METCLAKKRAESKCADHTILNHKGHRKALKFTDSHYPNQILQTKKLHWHVKISKEHANQQDRTLLGKLLS